MHSARFLSSSSLFRWLCVGSLLVAAPSAANAARHTYLATYQGETRVWVNSSSHVYHCPGSRYYGATKRGSYATEGEARANGNRPAYGQACGPLTEPMGSARPLGDFGRGSDVEVWVNTSSGVYHCPGSQYFRKTKRGRLMSEREAKASGKRPAYGKSCS